MEGLEVSIVPLSKVLASTETHRIDPEYFQKQHLADEALATSRRTDFQTFADLGLSVDGSAFYPAIEEFYNTGDLPFLRVADVDSVIDFQRCTRIPAILCDRMPTLCRVHPGDIVFTKGGSIARIGLVTEVAAASRDLIFLNSSKLAEADRLFLYLYLQTPFFNRMLLRSSSQTAQPHLTITLVRHLPTLRAGDILKRKCVDLVRAAYAAREESIAKTGEAEATLTAALGLGNWQPPEPLSYTRLASEAFAAGRLDAEYFAPRVTELIVRLSAAGLAVSDVAPPRREKFSPASRGNFRYIEISDMRSDGTVGDSTLPQHQAPSRATQFARAGDVLTSTVRPNRRLSAIVGPEQDGCVASSGFVVLEPRAIPAEVLLTYLRLPLFCELMDLHTSASLYPAISERDLLALPFPHISEANCRAVVSSVRAAHAARTRARSLLTAAQRAVEIAMEDSEAAAINYLKGI